MDVVFVVGQLNVVPLAVVEGLAHVAFFADAGGSAGVSGCRSSLDASTSIRRYAEK